MRGALPWLGLVFAHLLPQNFGFDPSLVSVGFVVDDVAVEQVYFRGFGLPMSASIHPPSNCPMLIYLPRSQYSLSQG